MNFHKKGGPASPGLSARVAKLPTLVEEVSGRIMADIQGGVLVPGARLPTEREMMAGLGVSRTVVREAVAQLRANGVVTTRQGLGAFVAENALVQPLHIPQDELRVIGDLIYLTELRLAIELESAALAVHRGSDEQIRQIGEALDLIDAAVAKGELGAAEDFAFHKQIALATDNPHFPRMMDFLGQYIIPRKAVNSLDRLNQDYLAFIQTEHRAIYEAIQRRDAEAAQKAVRVHLGGSVDRLSKIASQELAVPGKVA